MTTPEQIFSRDQVLHMFRASQIYLLLGAAITTIGILAAAFATLRRRFDALLLWFSLFAVLYGTRLILYHQIVWRMGPAPSDFERIATALGYLVPIPAFYFFRALNLVNRVGRILIDIVAPALGLLSLITLVIGLRHLISNINNTIVTALLIVFIVNLIRNRDASTDVRLIHRGLFVFIASALYENILGIFGSVYNVEPFAFLFVLAALGIVAGRRTLAREQQLSVIQKELEIAQRIQLSILPTQLPSSGSFRVAARYLPMTTVAGDFYDVLASAPHETGLLIADVSGHGIPAALIASMVKLAAAAERDHIAHPARLLEGMNRALCGNTQSQFVTAGYVYLNAATNELRYAAAAHPPMLLLRGDNVIEIEENGLMLAAFDFATYTTRTLPLHPDDRLVLYTDGLLEAADAAGEEFGRDRLHAQLRDTVHLPPAEAADRIIHAVQHFAAIQNDDLTILVCDHSSE
ncbi:MAG: PP2C family protein-serine/threonine phosphatase [Edaphobacter sp.]|uniref:PP2C family protein-serine/threonine phosphatase n=1 Tax=Edaphobacter sp. TaxID=1934404 RepID=UPI002393131E|nr:PP2C family protein-serine/threonine phosphatase [Edaphobacter sp.]MDE1178788.1 PP2C family protein-serine/threonine phosphatase [Edaphobacter sp.]